MLHTKQTSFLKLHFKVKYQYNNNNNNNKKIVIKAHVVTYESHFVARLLIWELKQEDFSKKI